MAYLTLSEAKEWLGIKPGDTAYDAIVTDLIATVEEAIRAYCECQFTPTVVTGEVHAATRRDVIVPNEWPVISVQKVVVGIGLDGTGGTELSTDDYIVRQESIELRWSTTGHGRGRVSIDYTHGFESVPKLVKQATRIGVEAHFRQWQRKSVGTTSKSKEGESVSFKGAWDGASGLPVEATSLLQDFRFMEFPGSNEMATKGW